MCIYTNSKSPKIKKTALIWHSCSLSNFLVNKFGWTLVQSKDQFEDTDFNQFDEIIFLAEASWDKIGHSKMQGIKMMLDVIKKVNLNHTSIQLFSFYSNQYLEKNAPNSYRQSIMLFKSEHPFISNLNVWNFNNLANKKSMDLMKYLFYGDSHDTNVLDLLIKFSMKVYKLKFNENSLNDLKNPQFGISFFSKIGQIKHNYIQIIKMQENIYFKLVTEKFKLYSVVRLIQKLENLKVNEISTKSYSKIGNNLLTLNKHFIELNNFLNKN